MKKIIALVLITALTAGCATVPNGAYDTSQSSSSSPSQDTSNGSQSTRSSWNGTTIFWTVIGIALVGAAAKKASDRASDRNCYTGPRGGTYTLTSNGNKNYSGC